jgi:hypothetical protein
MTVRVLDTGPAIGTGDDVAWIAGHTTDGLTVTASIPPRFDAYATFYPT